MSIAVNYSLSLSHSSALPAAASDEPPAKRQKKNGVDEAHSKAIKETALAALSTASSSSKEATPPSLAAAPPSASASTSTAASAAPTTTPFFEDAESFFKHILIIQSHAIKKDMERLFKQIITQRKEWYEHAIKKKASHFVSSSKTLPRSVFCTVDNRIFVLFNKATQNDFLLGKGGNKKVKVALSFETGRWQACSSLDKDSFHEIDRYRLIKDVPGVCQINEMVRYVNKEKVEKIRFLTTLQPRTLYDFLKGIYKDRKSISMKIRWLVLWQIFHVVIGIHKKGVLYRDLKPQNILMTAANKIHLTDFGSVCKEDDSEARKKRFTSAWESPPEIATIFLRPDGENADYTSANSKALDMWSLGTILFAMLYSTTPPWCVYFQNEREALEGLAYGIEGLEESMLPKPIHENSLQYLLWRMWMIDPSKRLTSEELEARLKTPLGFIVLEKDSYFEVVKLQKKLNEIVKSLNFMNKAAARHAQDIVTMQEAISKIIKRIKDIRKNPACAVLNATNTEVNEEAIYVKALTSEIYSNITRILKPKK